MLRVSVVLATLFLPALANAAPRPVIVQDGKPKDLIQLVHTDSKACTIKPPGHVQVEKPPQHGTVKIVQSKAAGNHPTCGRIEGTMLRVVYTPKPGYSGRDEVEVVLTVEPDQTKSGARERRFMRIPVDVLR